MLPPRTEVPPQHRPHHGEAEPMVGIQGCGRAKRSRRRGQKTGTRQLLDLEMLHVLHCPVSAVPDLTDPEPSAA